jgi:CheY-like chemotaxis protein
LDIVIVFCDEALVFLDFRLNPSDFENKNSQEITSIKLLKEIKKRNPGIQVIIFSATNKILNLQALQEARADAFVLKDSGDKIRFTITKFIEVITLSIKKSNILKPIHCSFNKLEMNGINLNEGFKINLKVNLSICFDLLIRSFENEKFINYAFLQLFLIIEEFIKQNEIFEEGTDCFVRNAFGDVCVAKRIGDSIECALTLTSNGKYEIRKSSFRVSNKFKRFDINFIMSSILIFKYGNKSSSVVNWTKIYKIRNGKAAHFSKEDIDSKVKIEEVSILIEFLKYTLDLSNENSENISKGLILKTIEESINEAKKNNPRFKSKK